MSIGFWQIAIVVVLVVLLFGRGKISDLMGDVAKGIKSFKKGMKDPTQDQIKDSLKIKRDPHHQKINLAKNQNQIKNNLKCHKLDGLKY